VVVEMNGITTSRH